MVTFPMVPIHAIPKAGMFTLEIQSIKVGIVTCAVPPGPGESLGTILAPGIIIPVNCTIFGTTSRKTFSKIGAENQNYLNLEHKCKHILSLDNSFYDIGSTFIFEFIPETCVENSISTPFICDPEVIDKESDSIAFKVFKCNE